MKPCLTLTLAVLASLALCGTPAFAHGHCGGHHHGCSSCPPGDRSYDPDSVTTLQGTATEVEVVPARGGRSGGLHLTLSSGSAATEVHVGPSWFLEREGFRIAKGDALEVTGSLVDSDGTRFVVAREIKKGSAVIRLRDEQGVPAWSGRP
jgi:hypothetical protein